MTINSKRGLRPVRTRSYLNKDFDSFRSELLQYARTYYSDKIEDFSEASMGGLLLDLVSYVGDVMSFYLDHQFNELNIETAVESENVQRLLRTSGVEITGKSPAVVDVDFYIEVSAEIINGVKIPHRDSLPLVTQGTTVVSNSGIIFELVADVNFAARDRSGILKAQQAIGTVDAANKPLTFILKSTGPCVSGTRFEDSFSIPNILLPYRTITLNQTDVTSIISVIDSTDNHYYEVNALSDSVVFQAIPNPGADNLTVEENLEILPAPYRYTRSVDFSSQLTTLQFGTGDANTFDNDVVPDPSKFSFPLYGKKTMTRFSIDPNNFLRTQTLGISPTNTTLTVSYRAGGGLAHNVGARTIRNVQDLRIIFPASPAPAVASAVRSSIDVNNPAPAAGGENAPTLAEMRSKVPAARNSQNRIVSKSDLLARIYTMPSNFGRVFRAGLRSSPTNSLATQLFIISRNEKEKLVISPDALKNNLRLYLNEFRMVSDAIDILDAMVVNIGIKFEVTAGPDANKAVLLEKIISNIKEYMKIENFEIDQPIILSDLNNIIYNTDGVLSVTQVQLRNYAGIVGDRSYSSSSVNLRRNTFQNIVIPPPGGIFEVRFPEFDIIGNVY